MAQNHMLRHTSHTGSVHRHRKKHRLNHTHVAPNVAIHHAYMLSPRGCIRPLRQHTPVLVVFDLKVRIVETLKLKHPILIALFIARPLEEATASATARAIRTVHAQLKGLEAMGGKGGFAELANWVVSPRPRFGRESTTRASSSPPNHTKGGFEGGVLSSGAGDFGSVYMGGASDGGGRHASGRSGYYGPTNGRSYRRRGGRQLPRFRSLLEVYPRGFDFHEPPPYDLLIENTLSTASRAMSTRYAPIEDAHQERPVVCGRGTSRMTVGSDIRT